MPDLAGPFDQSTFAQAQYYRDRGHLEPAGVQGAPAATAAAGDLGLTAAGFALTMGLGRAHVRGAAYERTGTAWTYTAPANTSAAGPRNDLLVLRRDLTAKTVAPTYVQGTAAATPADPATAANEDTTYDLLLFRVQAPANSGTPLVITDLRRWLRDNVADTGWVNTGLNAPLVTGAEGSRYRVKGGIAYVQTNFAYSGAYSSPYTLYTLPAVAWPAVTQWFTAHWYDGATFELKILPTGEVQTSGGVTKTGGVFSASWPVG